MSLKNSDDLLLVPEQIRAVTVGNLRHCYLRHCRVLICLFMYKLKSKIKYTWIVYKGHIPSSPRNGSSLFKAFPGSVGTIIWKYVVSKKGN